MLTSAGLRAAAANECRAKTLFYYRTDVKQARIIWFFTTKVPPLSKAHIPSIPQLSVNRLNYAPFLHRPMDAPAAVYDSHAMKALWLTMLSFWLISDLPGAPLITSTPTNGTKLSFDSTLQIVFDAQNEDGTRTNLLGRFLTNPTNGTAMTEWVRTTNFPYSLTFSNMPPGLHRYRISVSDGPSTTDLFWDIEVGAAPDVPAGPFSLLELGQDVFPNGINNSGKIIGYKLRDGVKRAYAHQNGTTRELETFGPGESEAIDINDNGIVVGWSMTSSGKKNAALWLPDGLRSLPQLTNENSFATGINDLGHIIGIDGNTGFILRNETLLRFGFTPYALNNNGLIVGREATFESALPREAVSIQGGVFRGTPPDAADRVLLAVNDSGLSAGWGYVRTGQEYGHGGMLYKTRSQFEATSTSFGDGFKENLSINKWGQYVGFDQSAWFNYDPYDGPLGFNLNPPKGTLNSADLNTQLAEPTDLVLRKATGINDYGQIIGIAQRNGTNVGFLLTPLLKLNIQLSGPTPTIQTSGSNYQQTELQSSEDLVHWNAVATNTVTAGTVNYEDGATSPKRFYRSIRRK
jgi:probable HAF family extracellular repeat protein